MLSTQPFSELTVDDRVTYLERENAFLRTEIATLKKRFEDHVNEWTV